MRNARFVVTALCLIAGAFAAIAFAASALLPGLAARTAVVVFSLLGFVALAWTRILDNEERAYAREIALRATARFRIA